ncbi:AfsR/SARP family transcriptional regulator [Streptomyces buecherae]|uniref:AfsR/SARP family transcriptional regulator n=1 Tax=Streptomyces buecherae TaxID=2763006 RepID=UPI00379EE281
MTEPSGYALLVAEGDLDLSRFEALRSRARAAERAGDLECASALFGQALEVWRGPALADVRALAELNTEAERLDEARMRVQEQHVATDLLLDRHWDAVPRLTELTKQHPLRESLHEHLILAQYRCGRTAESLETYTKIRGDLVRQIGMEPGVRLQSLHRAILNRDPVLDTGLLLAS